MYGVYSINKRIFFKKAFFSECFVMIVNSTFFGIYSYNKDYFNLTKIFCFEAIQNGGKIVCYELD